MPLELSSFLKGAGRVAIIGVGSELRGDDVAGLEVVRRLRRKLKSPKVLLVEGGVAPENFTAEIRRFKPSHVFIVDATDFGAEPGEVILAEPEAVVGQSISTHTMPLSILASYLREQTGAKVLLMGVQPASAMMGATMSEQVMRAIDELTATLFAELGTL